MRNINVKSILLTIEEEKKTEIYKIITQLVRMLKNLFAICTFKSIS